MQPILSIVIPTKDRYEYLESCIHTLLDLKSRRGNIEIVVQDNSIDNKIFYEKISGILKDISYFYVKESISVVDNCNLAIEHATGRYVCMLGDDDSVADAIIDVAFWMQNHDIESCIGRIVRYNWPDLVFDLHKFPTLSIPFQPNNINYLDPINVLIKCLSEGAYRMDKLPKVYHAIVSNAVLNKVKYLSGSYFPGPSPDMANAIALCPVLKNHVIINVPIVISGFSYKSGGGMGTRRQHIGKIEDIPHLPKDTAIVWEPKIPRYWTAETIYAESVIKALRNSGYNSYIGEFNYSASYAAFISYNSSFWKLTLPYIDSSKKMFLVLFYCIRVFIRRVCNFIFNLLETKLHISRNVVFFDISTLEDAVSCVNEFNKKKKWDILKQDK